MLTASDYFVVYFCILSMRESSINIIFCVCFIFLSQYPDEFIFYEAEYPRINLLLYHPIKVYS